MAALNQEVSAEVVFRNASLLIQKNPGKSNEGVNWLVIHHNEYEAQKVMEWALENIGGTGYNFINRRRPRQRTLREGRGKLSYLFDPNRIFSREGILKNLRHYNGIFLHSRRYRTYEKRVISHIFENYAAKIRSLLPLDKKKYLIALHNTMNKSKFSLLNYRKKFGYTIYQNPDLHPKNFALVIRYEDFVKLKEAKINVVWQKETKKIQDDGSLAHYCKKNGYRYINVEGRFGDMEEHKKMVQTIYDLVTKP
ncbi:MAG: hypothetical protein CVV50_02910 [Spirochaetae bacterium HGW-Spirochaetae-6]|nr:MAG: hypothetical protein CVV50_02910 [Spirochaetae bacterium HGW-Spirochaetae-6]